MTDYNIRRFDIVDTHGCATTEQLRLATGANKTNNQDICTDLYHGTLDGKYYFDRHEVYRKDENARQWNHVYENSDLAREELAKRKMLSPFTKRYDHRIHRLFGATFGISSELLAPEHGVRYMRRHEVLSKNGKPLALGNLIPDDLYGLQYDSGKKRYFAVEIDRGNEPVVRLTSDGTSIADKLEHYYRAIDKETYKDEWGIGMMMVMIVTTAQLRITGKNGIFAHINATRPDLAECFLAKAYPIFHTDKWQVPAGLFRDVYNPWQRADGVMFDITKQ